MGIVDACCCRSVDDDGFSVFSLTAGPAPALVMGGFVVVVVVVVVVDDDDIRCGRSVDEGFACVDGWNR